MNDKLVTANVWIAASFVIGQMDGDHARAFWVAIGIAAVELAVYVWREWPERKRGARE